jgi:hypothetical protein
MIVCFNGFRVEARLLMKDNLISLLTITVLEHLQEIQGCYVARSNHNRKRNYFKLRFLKYLHSLRVKSPAYDYSCKFKEEDVPKA